MDQQPIELPPPLAVGMHARSLTQPTIPPSDDDVVNAREYLHEVRLAKYKDFLGISNVEYAQAIRYDAKVVASTGAAQPPWLDDIIQRLDTIQNQVTQLRNEVTQNRIEDVQARTEITRILARVENQDRGGGRDVGLTIVPFPSGQHPSEHVPALPLLNTIGAVKDLNAFARNRYLQQYYPGEAPRGSTQERENKLLRALGCKDLDR